MRTPVAVPMITPEAMVTVGAAARALIKGDAADKTARPESKVTICLNDMAIVQNCPVSDMVMRDAIAARVRRLDWPFVCTLSPS